MKIKLFIISGLLVATIFGLGVQLSSSVYAAEDIIFDPDIGGEYDFGELKLGDKYKELDIWITNNSDRDLTLVKVLGADSDTQFASGGQKGKEVRSRIFRKIPGQNTNKGLVSVIFMPLSPTGKKQGTLNIKLEDAESGTLVLEQRIDLSGVITGTPEDEDEDPPPEGENPPPEDKKIFESQCQSGKKCGEQTGCTRANDNKILNGQCKDHYGFDSPKCSSMENYLNALQSDCNNTSPPVKEVECSTISEGGFYGREAAKFAKFLAGISIKGEECGGDDGPPDDIPPGESKGIYIPGEKETGLSEKSIQQILLNLLTWLLEILGVLAILGFVISGIQYIVASGNEDIMENAKRNMTYAIIGIIVALSSVVVVKAIENVLKAKSLI